MEAFRRIIRKHPLIAFVSVAVVYLAIILIIVNPLAFSFLKEYVLLIAGILVLLAIMVGSQDIFMQKAKRRMELTEYERIISDETHPVLNTRIVKDVKILTKDGDAHVVYKITCKNTSGGIIPQLLHEIKHDGTLEQYSATVNDKEAKATFDKFLITKINGAAKLNLSHILKIKYDLKDEKINPEDTFSYGYTLEYKGLFADMLKPLEEFTAHHIMHPTKLLMIKITAPKGFRFLATDGMSIEVTDKNEVRVDREELRCKKMYWPQLFNDDSEIFWELLEPKIACTYALHFTMSKG